MSALAVRREVRRRMRQAKIARLEQEVGVEVSYPASNLPVVEVVRNPEGSWSMGDRWVARGFPGYLPPEAMTKRLCVIRARRRLRAMMQAEVEPVTVVKP